MSLRKDFTEFVDLVREGFMLARRDIKGQSKRIKALEQKLCEHDWGLRQFNFCGDVKAQAFQKVCLKCDLEVKLSEKEYNTLQKKKVIKDANLALAQYGMKAI